MAGTTNNFDLPYQEVGDAPNGPTLGQDLAEATDAALLGLQNALNVGTTGTWTPSVTGWSLSGTWAGTWRRIGPLMYVEAKITTTVAFNPPFPSAFSVTGLPATVGGFAVASAYGSWGNHPWPAMADGTTLYVHLTSSAGSQMPAGQVVRVDALFVPTS